MRNILKRYKTIRFDKSFYLLLLGGLFLLAISIFFNTIADTYTAKHYTSGISDIILDHLPVVNVEYIFLEGTLLFIGFIIFLGLHKPALLPFMLKASALFIATRAFFITLTHLGPPLHQALFIPQSFLEKLIYGSGEDLFFSGHTGFPFIMTLIFWDYKPLRYFFLACTVFFGGTVLLGHLHYSIDVFSAIFICFGVYHLSVKFFKKDCLLFKANL